jgi:hypothetical protein
MDMSDTTDLLIEINQNLTNIKKVLYLILGLLLLVIVYFLMNYTYYGLLVLIISILCIIVLIPFIFLNYL